jgi:adenine-specific DNA-methyltransferase
MAKRTSSKEPASKQVVTLTHDEASRKNIPTAEYESVMRADQQSPLRVAYERRNRDLDPQLVWRGKDEQDWSDLVVPAPPLFIQEKVHPKVLIDDLKRQSDAARLAAEVLRQKDIGIGAQIDLFADFNGLPDNDAKTDFYAHDAHWANRLILGDSLQVMASLAEREGLRGKVQCIYLDPPYGIKFNSNFQWSTTSRDVKDGSVDHMTREPEQVKAFRDTWRDGIHSYLTYLRDRLVVCRDLLIDSGSVFLQIGEENVHLLRTLCDEVFGVTNQCSQIVFRKTTGKGGHLLDQTYDVILWYAKDKASVKFRPTFEPRTIVDESNLRFVQLSDLQRRRLTNEEVFGLTPLPPGSRVYRPNPLTNQRPAQGNDMRDYKFEGRVFRPGNGTFRTDANGMDRLSKTARLLPVGTYLTFIRYLDDFPMKPRNDIWDDTRSGGFAEDKIYVVQTGSKVIERCLLMTTDPGDLVLDPTCGSGTTAYVAEQWGRRWITIDTSRVALALARARIMGARYPFYLKADSREGQLKEAEVSRTEPSTAPTHDSLRQGFVYERVPHITLKSIANNAEIDVIWEKFEKELSAVRGQLSVALKSNGPLEEWEIPREADPKWAAEARGIHSNFWALRIGRQKEIDASIAAKAEFEFLYDKPYEDKKKVRVAGPFTVESLSPHRVMTVGADDELIDPQQAARRDGDAKDFAQMILDNLRTAGVQQADKKDKINFTSLAGWPGTYICADGRYLDETGIEKRAGIFIGSEFGTVGRQDLVMAAREAGEAGFDVLIACAFNYEAHASEFNKLGRIPVLKARMNAELHMGTELKNTGKGNLFVIFGEPDIQILPPEDAPENADLKNFDMIRVRINGVDVFHPNTGEVRSDGADGIACWFIDTNYNEESFFVRQAYFLGANDPYKSLKTTLRAEINEEAWSTLNSDTSRAFPKPTDGKIAVKVINRCHWPGAVRQRARHARDRWRARDPRPASENILGNRTGSIFGGVPLVGVE